MSKMKERWAELEQAAKDATPGPWIAEDWASTDSDGAINVCGTSVIAPKSLCGIFTVALEGDGTNDVDYIAAANPAAILELLEVTKGLAEALRAVVLSGFPEGPSYEPVEAKARAALAKYEGVQSE